MSRMQLCKTTCGKFLMNNMSLQIKPHASTADRESACQVTLAVPTLIMVTVEPEHKHLLSFRGALLYVRLRWYA